MDQATLEQAINEARTLFQADGGDLHLESVEGNVVTVRIVVPEGSSGPTMPKMFVEDIVAGTLHSALPEISKVVVIDPRE